MAWFSVKAQEHLSLTFAFFYNTFSNHHGARFDSCPGPAVLIFLDFLTPWVNAFGISSHPSFVIPFTPLFGEER
jgi:hypothetical protein